MDMEKSEIILTKNLTNRPTKSVVIDNILTTCYMQIGRKFNINKIKRRNWIERPDQQFGFTTNSKNY